MKNMDWEELDTQALGAIRLSLSNKVRPDVIHEKTTKGLMDTLQEMFEKPRVVEQMHLLRKLFSMKMAKGGSVRRQ